MPQGNEREREGSALERAHLMGIPREDAGAGSRAPSAESSRGGAEAEGPALSAGVPDAEGLFEVKAQLARARAWETPHVLEEDGRLEMGPAAKK